MRMSQELRLTGFILLVGALTQDPDSQTWWFLAIWAISCHLVGWIVLRKEKAEAHRRELILKAARRAPLTPFGAATNADEIRIDPSKPNSMENGS